MAEQPRGAGQRPFFRQIAVWLSLRRLAAVNKSLRLVHSVPVEVDEWSRELLHVHSSTLGDPCTVAKPPIGTNHEVADFATPQRLTELPPAVYPGSPRTRTGTHVSTSD